MARPNSFPTRNDLPADVREKSIKLLNQQLADTFDLYSQTKQAHWNVKGIHFIALHELFDKLAESVLGYVDMIAERATALGGTALGTARMAGTSSRLPEYPLDITAGKAHVDALSARFAALGKTTRAAIDAAQSWSDADTTDLFTEISRELDQHLWFLETHLID